MYPTRPDEPSAWVNLEAAQAEVAEGHADGIGMCLPEGLCVIDIDDVLHGGILTADIQQITDRWPTWTEISPSGTGLHLWFVTDVPLRSGQAGSLELLATGRFITITGLPFHDTERVAPLPDELSALFRPVEQVTPARQESRSAQPHSLPSEAFSRALQHSEPLRRLYLFGDRTGFKSSSETDLACLQLIHRWAGDDPAVIDALFRQSALYRKKWECTAYRERTLALVLRSGRWST